MPENSNPANLAALISELRAKAAEAEKARAEAEAALASEKEASALAAETHQQEIIRLRNETVTKDQAASAKAEADTLNVKLAEATKRLDTAQADLRALSKGAESSKNTIENLNTQIEDQAQASKVEVDALNVKLAEAIKQSDTAKADLRTLTQDTDTSKNTIENLNAQIDDLQKQLSPPADTQGIKVVRRFQAPDGTCHLTIEDATQHAKVHAWVQKGIPKQFAEIVVNHSDG